jgi:hypothetical protein
VRSGSDRTATATADYLGNASKLLAPGKDDVASMLQPASTPADSDARVLGAGGDARKDKAKPRRGEVVLTDSQCRTGS